MKTFLLAGAMVMFAAIASGEAIGQCRPALTDRSLDAAACLYVEAPLDLPVQVTTTVKVDPKTVAAMTPLSQVDIVVREVAVAK